jgi:hypothetical protein
LAALRLTAISNFVGNCRLANSQRAFDRGTRLRGLPRDASDTQTLTYHKRSPGSAGVAVAV